MYMCVYLTFFLYFSLAWCFSYYHATLKRGALDKDLAALFYRTVLFLSVLFQILGRIFIFVLFAYSFGNGMYYPMLVFLTSHIVLMAILHFIFSDAKKVRAYLFNKKCSDKRYNLSIKYIFQQIDFVHVIL